MHPLTREFKELTRKRSSDRTIDDEMSIMHLEWLAGVYHDGEIGPYLPGANVKTALAEAATRWRKGATVRRSLVVVEQRLPLEYAGPRDLDALWSEGYRDVRGAVTSGQNRGRVTRCRPCFEETIAEFAQIRGLGDFRPDFGTFTAEWTEAEK
jgi:hypothetical protein